MDIGCNGIIGDKDDKIDDIIAIFKELPNLKLIYFCGECSKFCSYDFKLAYKIAHNIQNLEDVKILCIDN